MIDVGKLFISIICRELYGNYNLRANFSFELGIIKVLEITR
jgi:hypothetical protein